MSTNAFTALANTRLPSQSRSYSNSCCPDKDLIVLFSRLGGNDRMSLWNYNQGTRKWDVDVGDGEAPYVAVGMAWSPDGQSIAVARHPPSIAIHSIQNGHRVQVLPVTSESHPVNLAGVWWFRDDKEPRNGSNIPDIFKREHIVPGSAHSVLKILPLLDHLQEESENSTTATDMFAFQGSHIGRVQKSTRLPSVIEEWPTLASDPISASISTSTYSKSTLEKAELDEMDNLNISSILLAADDKGQIFSFLDGIYTLGNISLGLDYGFLELLKHPFKPHFVGQPHLKHGVNSCTQLKPVLVDIPLLVTRTTRDLAKLSTTARELSWYLTRTVKEMRDAWFGSESQSGARDLGPKWIRAFEAKQKEFAADVEPNPILDLTVLLTTGRASEPLVDFLGSGQDMGDRGIQKWETTVTEALIKLRDFGERRFAPALQRLYLVLDELVGWASLPQYAPFHLNLEELMSCSDLASRGILLASWLAGQSRRELFRFKEFISWLRFEVNTVNSPNDANSPRHDILEVNSYFTSGLAKSFIDAWFIGPTPHFQLADLNIPESTEISLAQAISRAREVASDPVQTAWQMTATENDLSHLDRNLEALIQELTRRCQRVFHDAAGAPSRSALVSSDLALKSKRLPEEERPLEKPLAFSFRERTALNEDGGWLQHLAVHMPTESSKSCILLSELRLRLEATELPSGIGVALLECYLPEEGEESNIELLDADFFDDECVVIVYRLRAKEKQTFIATLSYADVGYQNLPYDEYVKNSAREDLMQHSLELWKNGHLTPTKIAVNRHRLLSGCRTGDVTLALNGRKGRRVACILDSTGTTLESFDLEGDGEEMEVADDARAD